MKATRVAWIALILGVIVTWTYAFLFYKGVHYEGETARIASSMKQLAALCRAYSELHDGSYPEQLDDLSDSGLLNREELNQLTTGSDDQVIAGFEIHYLPPESLPSLTLFSALTSRKELITCSDEEEVTISAGELPARVRKPPH